MFSDEEVKQLDDAFLAAWRDGGGVLKVAIKTAELLAARGGTMTAEDIAVLAKSGLDEDVCVLRHISTQGARVAMLEKEQNDAFDLLGRLRSVDEQYSEETKLRERLHSAEESVRELTRRAQQAEANLATMTQARDYWQRKCATLSAACQVLSEHVDKAHECAWAPAYDGQVCHNCSARRYPCSSTCTHDDAAKPGHPERVTERSEAVKALSEKILPGPDVIDGGPGSRGPVRVVSNGARDMADAYAEGAEAMRAACLEAVQERLRFLGITEKDAVWNLVKSAVEGAAP